MKWIKVVFLCVIFLAIELWLSQLCVAHDSLLASTFLGGEGGDGYWPSSVHAIDSDGTICVTGMTDSTLFPTTAGAFSTAFNGGEGDCYVARFSADFSTLLAATYLGGSDYDCGMAIWIDSSGSIYVCGDTASADFPVQPGAFDTTFNGSDPGPYGRGDVFVVKLSSDLSLVSAATFIGGSGHDIPKKMVMDNAGRLVITGHTNSGDFPVSATAYAPVKAGGAKGEDCFVAILTADLTGLPHATYLGGSGNDFCETLAVNSTGDIYTGGWISSDDFPTTPGAFDQSYNGYYYDGFIARFDNELSTLVASTYLGGSSWDFVYAMAIDSDSNIYVAGHTASVNYPTSDGAYDQEYNSLQGPGEGDDLFVTQVSADLSTLNASTYIGGTGWENAYGLIVDAGIGVVVCGNTSSHSFPVIEPAWQSNYGGGSRYNGDSFISILTLDLGELTASTYLGGSADDGGQWIQRNSHGQLIMTGMTASPDFPTTSGAFQPANNGGAFDAFAVLMDTELKGNPTPTPTAPMTPTPEPTQTCSLGVALWMPLDIYSPGDTCQCLVTVCNDTGSILTDYPLFVILDIAGALYFAPSFNPDFDHYLMDYPSFPEGESIVEILPSFQWPSGAGSFHSVHWYAGLTTPDMSQLAGNYDMFTFGWTEQATPVPIDMVDISAGTFEMGAPMDELCREPDEIFFTVTLTRNFSIQKTEVTQAQWETVFSSNPSYFYDVNRPVDSITWFDACIYCNRLSLTQGLTPGYYSDSQLTIVYDGEPPVTTGTVFWDQTADGYRLPTEAEWEYACRAGSITTYCNHLNSSDCTTDSHLDPVAWYRSNSDTGSGRETHRVGLKQPNEWGLFNMHGNVGEWCWDWYGPYPLGSSIDPTGPITGLRRISRGGAFNYKAGYCRSGNRWHDNPGATENYYGFRVVRNR